MSTTRTSLESGVYKTTHYITQHLQQVHDASSHAAEAYQLKGTCRYAETLCHAIIIISQ